MARRRPTTKPSGSKCCVTDVRGRTVACFSGAGAALKAAQLQRIVKKSKTTSSCALPARGRR
jgi:hypothetical protein